MAAFDQGVLAKYNSLTDKHLVNYFSNERMRDHLLKNGLITKSGEVVPDAIYRIRIARREHRRRVRDLIAQAIIHKALEMERGRQIDIRKKIEEIAKIELVRRVREDRSRIGDEDCISYFSPGNMDIPPRSSKKKKRRQPDSYENLLPETPEEKSRSRLKKLLPNEEIESKHLTQLDSLTLAEYSKILQKHDRERINKLPYLGLGRVPNRQKRKQTKGKKSKNKKKEDKENKDDAIQTDDIVNPDVDEIKKEDQKSSEKVDQDVENLNEDLNRTSLVNLADEESVELIDISKENDNTNDNYFNSNKINVSNKRKRRMYDKRKYINGLPKSAGSNPPPKMQSLAKLSISFHAPSVHRSYDIMVEQQPSGGNTLVLFRDTLTNNGIFTIVSQRHKGYPFSLTFYIDNVKDSRISTCCEFKHKIGKKIGGPNGHFSLVSVENANPCYRAVVNGDHLEGHLDIWKRVDSQFSVECLTEQDMAKEKKESKSKNSKSNNELEASRQPSSSSTENGFQSPYHSDDPFETTESLSRYSDTDVDKKNVDPRENSNNNAVEKDVSSNKKDKEKYTNLAPLKSGITKVFIYPRNDKNDEVQEHINSEDDKNIIVPNDVVNETKMEINSEKNDSSEFEENDGEIDQELIAKKKERLQVEKIEESNEKESENDKEVVNKSVTEIITLRSPKINEDLKENESVNKDNFIEKADNVEMDEKDESILSENSDEKEKKFKHPILLPANNERSEEHKSIGSSGIEKENVNVDNKIVDSAETKKETEIIQRNDSYSIDSSDFDSDNEYRNVQPQKLPISDDSDDTSSSLIVKKNGPPSTSDSSSEDEEDDEDEVEAVVPSRPIPHDDDVDIDLKLDLSNNDGKISKPFISDRYHDDLDHPRDTVERNSSSSPSLSPRSPLSIKNNISNQKAEEESKNEMNSKRQIPVSPTSSSSHSSTLELETDSNDNDELIKVDNQIVEELPLAAEVFEDKTQIPEKIEVCVEGDDINFKRAKDICQQFQNSQVHSLILRNCELPNYVFNFISDKLQTHSELQSIELSGCEVEISLLNLLAKVLEKWQNLENIILCDNQFTDYSLQNLIDMIKIHYHDNGNSEGGLQNLKLFDLSNCSVQENDLGQLIFMIENNTRLETFKLDGTGISSTMLQDFCKALKGNNHIKTLSLENCGITQSMLDDLGEELTENIRGKIKI